MSRQSVGGVTGVIGAIVGGFMGYRQAIEVGMEPWLGALILGGVGLVLGSAGGFILRTLGAIVMYIILLGVLAYFFRDQIELLTNIDPIDAAYTIYLDCLNFLQGQVEDRRVQ